MKITIRQCRACKTDKNRDEMFKITLSNNALFFNPGPKITGRSVYVCKNKGCVEKLVKSKGIKKGLRFNNETLIQEIENKLFEESIAR